MKLLDFINKQKRMCEFRHVKNPVLILIHADSTWMFMLTNKNDLINISSYNNDKIEYEIITTYYLWVLRIHSSDYLTDEEQYKESTLKIPLYSSYCI